MKRNDQSYYEMIENMETYGGSFVKALAQCFRHADPINLQKLIDTFPEYVRQYTSI